MAAGGDQRVGRIGFFGRGDEMRAHAAGSGGVTVLKGACVRDRCWQGLSQRLADDLRAVLRPIDCTWMMTDSVYLTNGKAYPPKEVLRVGY
ncbi:hypothetical protein GCM10027296_26670 [Chitinimonas naiadis]